MGLVVIAALLEVCFELTRFVMDADGFLLDLQEIFTVLGWFLVVLIALELMASVAAFLEEKVIKVEFMYVVAITAVARKIVTMDSKEAEPLYLVGLAGVILALSIGYYLSKKASFKFRIENKGSLNP